MTSRSTRLWSLWDMLQVRGSWFVSVIAYIARLEGVFSMGNATNQNNEISTETIRESAESLKKQLLKVNVPASIASVGELIAMCSQPRRYSELAPVLAQINSRLTAELKGQQLFLMTQAESAMFEKRVDPEVEAAFANSVEDLIEAAKSLGLGRYTASVFHLMRAMECAVQELSQELKIPDVEKEWGKLLSEMEKKIKLMRKGDRKDAWSESHSHLYHVKQAWRNKTMHPKKTYTQEEAEAVFSAVRSFMRHLAALLPGEAASAAV